MTLDKRKTLVKLSNLLEAQQAAGHDAYEHSRPSCKLKVAPCRLGQLTSEACKAAVDTASKQGAESHTALVIVCAWSASEVSVIGRYDDQGLRLVEVGGILDQFVHLDSVLSLSDGRAILGQLQICGSEDISQIRQWNADCPEGVMKLAHEIIMSQVNRRADGLAVSAWDARLTYGELDSFSETIAQRLLFLGVKPDSLVQFCFEKSAWAIVAMLGILKGGAAFVALDPTHPLERLNGIVQRIQAEVLLTSEASFERLRVLTPNIIVVRSRRWTSH